MYIKVKQGRRGEIYLNPKTQIVIKKALNNQKKAAINKEIQIILKLNKNNIYFVPKIIDYGDGRFSYYRIRGEHLIEFIKKYPNLEKQILNKLLNKIYQLDKLGIIHGELIRPYKNILINEKNLDIYIIDFERGKLGDFSGKNMKSFSQFLLQKKYINLNEIEKIGKLNINELYNFLKTKLS